MDEKVTKFLRDLSERMGKIQCDYVAGNGGELQSITINDATFERIHEALKDADYCDMEEGPLPGGASGVLWGIPLYADASQPDGELQFKLS